MRRIVALAVALALGGGATNALAAAPEACALLTKEELNKLARKGDAMHVEKRQGGKTTECVYLDAGKSAVLTVEIRESANPAGDLASDVAMFERMYKQKPKAVTGVGEQAWFIQRINGVEFRKGGLIAYLYFTGSKYGGEPAAVAVAQLLAGRLK